MRGTARPDLKSASQQASHRPKTSSSHLQLAEAGREQVREAAKRGLPRGLGAGLPGLARWPLKKGLEKINIS